MNGEAEDLKVRCLVSSVMLEVQDLDKQQRVPNRI